MNAGYYALVTTMVFHLLDAGHFALESRGSEIAAILRDFLARLS
jgi:hypothetical protein